MAKATYRGTQLRYELNHGQSHGDYDTMYGPKVWNVKGAIVLDIGADEGSTADYFFQNGAAEVWVSEIRPAFIAKLEEWALTEKRLLVLRAMESARDLEEWIYRARKMEHGGRLLVKMDADMGNAVDGGVEEMLLGLSKTFLGDPDGWVIETHTPESFALLWRRLTEVGYTLKLVRQWRSNPKVKVLRALRG